MRLTSTHLVVAGIVGVAAVTAVLTRPLGSTASPASAPATLEITAVIRDFRDYKAEGGHPDFQRWTGKVRLGIVDPFLGDDGKPVLRDRAGIELQTPYRNADGRPVNPFLSAINDLDEGDRGDEDAHESVFDDEDFDDLTEGLTHGKMKRSNSDRITSKERFDQWYRDVPGVNITTSMSLILHETEPGSGRFLFDSHGASTKQLNPWLKDLPVNGFFPINDRGFGNYSNKSNFHFTTEVVTTFTYRKGAGYTFGFSGDDDLWVFIGGRLVIDLGGLHSRADQWVDLDDLEWLEDGTDYAMHIFHAERRTSQSNFRIETTIPMRPLGSVSTFDAFD